LPYVCDTQQEVYCENSDAFPSYYFSTLLKYYPDKRISFEDAFTYKFVTFSDEDANAFLNLKLAL
jgi:hypothetical protein